MVPDEDGDLVIPSVAYFPENGDRPWVGKKAARKLETHAEFTVYDSKRMLTKKINDENIEKLKPNWPFKLDHTPNGDI